MLLSVRRCVLFCGREASVRALARGGWGSAATIDAAGAAPLAREPVSVPPRCLQCMLQSSEGIWRSPEAVRRARGAAFEPEARQLAIALAARERIAQPNRSGPSLRPLKLFSRATQTPSRTSLRPFLSHLTPSLQNGSGQSGPPKSSRSVSACTARPRGSCRGQQNAIAGPGLRGAAAAPSSDPLPLPSSPLPRQTTNKK